MIFLLAPPSGAWPRPRWRLAHHTLAVLQRGFRVFLRTPFLPYPAGRSWARPDHPEPHAASFRKHRRHERASWLLPQGCAQSHVTALAHLGVVARNLGAGGVRPAQQPCGAPTYSVAFVAKPATHTDTHTQTHTLSCSLSSHIDPLRRCGGSVAATCCRSVGRALTRKRLDCY